MSVAITKTITCKCGNEFDIEVYVSVNITADPELKEKVLKGEINSGECPKCRKKYQYFYPVDFIYNDMERLFQIIVPAAAVAKAVKSGRLKKCIEKMEKKYTIERAEKIRKRRQKEMKQIEKELGITVDEWHTLSEGELKKRLGENFKKIVRKKLRERMGEKWEENWKEWEKLPLGEMMEKIRKTLKE